MLVHEIFSSINGEPCTSHQGSMCTFIRFQGCNLKCPYCFGVVRGSSRPKIILSRGSNKFIDEVKVGDYLMTYDEYMNPVETIVEFAETREADSWMLIHAKGKKYYVTEEHPFFTTRGLIIAQDLKEGDMVLHSTFQENLSFMKTISNPMKDPEVVKRSVQNNDYAAIGRKISEHRKLHKWGSPISEEHKKKISEANSGERNGNWKGGKRRNYEFLKTKIRNGEIKNCYECGEEKPLDVHHIDENRDNDSMDNLKILCESCHYSGHKTGNNFWKGERSDGKTLIHPMHNGIRIDSIKHVVRSEYPPSTRPAPLTVHTLSCSPHNSYFVDYMWVHNCDTKQTQGLEGGIVKYIKDILREIQRLGNRCVTLTGGEPLIQKSIYDLIYELCYAENQYYEVSIETNGTVIPPFQRSNITYVMDYKLQSSGMTRFMKMPAFKRLTNHDFIKFVVSNKTDFDQAVFFIQRLVVPDHPRYIFSPVKDAIEPEILLGWMQDDRTLRKVGAIFSLQLHKMLGVK